jgi:hypothetical protein
MFTMHSLISYFCKVFVCVEGHSDYWQTVQARILVSFSKVPAWMLSAQTKIIEPAPVQNFMQKVNWDCLSKD